MKSPTGWQVLAVAESVTTWGLFALLLWQRRRRPSLPTPLLVAFGVLGLWGGLHLVSPPAGLWHWWHGGGVPIADRALFALFLILTSYALLAPLFPAYRRPMKWLLGSHLGFLALLTGAAWADARLHWRPQARIGMGGYWGPVVLDVYQAMVLVVLLAAVVYVYRHGKAPSLRWAGAAFAAWWLTVMVRLAEAVAHAVLPAGWGLAVRGSSVVGFGLLAVAFLRPDPSRRTFAERYFADAQEMVRRLEAELDELVAVQARLEERQRLARELHDSVSQALFTVELQLSTAEMLWEHDPQQARQRLAQARRLTHEALGDLRALIADLRPPTLAGKGLGEALADFARSVEEREGLPVTVEVVFQGEGALSAQEEAELYRIAYEAITNTVRHARATQVAIRLWLRPPDFRLVVEDDGQGFDPSRVPHGHWGLQGMQERAERLGAVFRLETGVGQGTRVEVVRGEV